MLCKRGQTKQKQIKIVFYKCEFHESVVSYTLKPIERNSWTYDIYSK